MAVPVWQSVGTAATTTTLSSITPGLPASVAAGNLLICVAQMNNKSTVLSMSGWNTLWARPFWNAGVYWTVFWRIATGSDPNTVATSVAPGGQTFNAQISRYTGNNTSGTIVGKPYAYRNSSSSSVNIHGGSIPIHGNNSLAVVMYLKSGAPTSLSTGYTQRLNNTTQVYSIFDANVTSYGYSPTFTAKYGAAANSVDYLAFEIYSDVPNSRAYPYIAQTQTPVFANAISSATVYFPANMTNGNILVIMAQHAAIAGWALAAGWKQVKQLNVNSSFAFTFMWKVIDGTEGASISLSFTTNNPHFAAWEIANASTVSPFQSFRHRAQPSATTAQDCNQAFSTAQDNVLACVWYGTGVENGLDLANDGATTWHRSGMDLNFALGFRVTEVPTAGTALAGFTETAASSSAYSYMQFEIWPAGANGPYIANSGTPANGVSATSVTLTAPASIVAGDFLLATVAAAVTTTVWDAPPAGWTKLGAGYTGQDTIGWFYKISDGTETSVTFTHGATSVQNYGNIICIRGHDATTPFGRLSCMNNGQANFMSGGQRRLVRPGQNSLLLGNNGRVSNSWPTTVSGCWGTEHMNNSIMGAGVFGMYTHQKGKINQTYSDDIITTGTNFTGLYGWWSLEILAAGGTTTRIETPYIVSTGFGGEGGGIAGTQITGMGLPPQRVVGDIFVMAMFFKTLPITLTAPGWNIYPTNFQGLYLLWKPVAGGEDDFTIPTITMSPSQAYSDAVPFLIANADRSSPLVNPPTTNSGTSAAAAIPSITTARANDLVLNFGFALADYTTPALASFANMVMQHGVTTDPRFAVHILEYSQAAAGASPADTLNIASSQSWAGMTLEVNHPFGTLGNQAVIIG